MGYAHNDYTVTEIKEAIESASAINIGNKVVQEQGNRLVRVVGTINTDLDIDNRLNDGKPVKTRLNWFIPIGSAVNLFAYNDGTVMLTGAVLKANGEIWVKDST